MSKTTHKTRLQWYNTLPEPIRTMAIENTRKEKLKVKDANAKESISSAFSWYGTPQGIIFWYLVSNGKYKKAIAILKKRNPELYAKYIKPDNPTKPEFKHSKENSVANLRIYFQQQKRLAGNADLIFSAMLKGIKVNGVMCADGAIYTKGGTPKFILESRKRFAEIRDYLRPIGIEVQTESARNGLKSHYLSPADINKIKKALKLK